MQNIRMSMNQEMFFDASCHIWTATAHHHWAYANPSRSNLTDSDTMPSCAEWSWPCSDHLTEFSYTTHFDSERKAQLFAFITEPPESLPVRALLFGDEPLTPSACDLFVLHVKYALLRKSSQHQWQEHDQWLYALQSLTASLDLDELLLHIMHNALHAIPAVDRGFLMLYDAESNLLVPKASVGMGPSIYEFKVAVGEGITGKVFQEGIGRIFDREQSKEAMKNIQTGNMENLKNASITDDVKFDQPIVMAVPVTMNAEQIGVLIVHQIKAKRQLTWHDLRRLQGFADLAAIAIYNAKLFTELRVTNEYLVKRSQIHEVFIQLSLQEADLTTVTKTVERMLGLPTALIDLAQNEWFPPQSPVASSLFDAEALSDWEQNKSAREVQAPSGIPVYLFPIIHGGVTLGCFAVETPRPLEKLDIVVLEQAGAVVALEMMNSYSLTELSYKKSYEFFNELLLFREPKQIVAKAKEFGLSASLPLFVVMLQITDQTQDQKRKETHLRRLIAELNKALGKKNVLIFNFHEKITIVLHVENRLKQNSLIKKLNAAISHWEHEETPPLYIGIGGVYAGLEHCAKSTEEASKSLSFLLNRAKPGMIRYEEIGINRLFLHQPPEEIERFIQEILAPLRSPKATASELEQTLKEYICANRSTSLTAARLHIHPNTLYHRLGKIEEILEVDLNDPDDWLSLYLACHLSQTY
ncbi:helix-turn-helix domain-containing protein [Brevibacillus sp. NRS-1366]|uniref:helix-turn-helix domain-containing protein n=1 Tax=Brevibacillus sp. NRS-1366 TaxID=3233899 RepID=UPI003D217E86